MKGAEDQLIEILAMVIRAHHQHAEFVWTCGCPLSALIVNFL